MTKVKISDLTQEFNDAFQKRIILKDRVLPNLYLVAELRSTLGLSSLTDLIYLFWRARNALLSNGSYKREKSK